MKNRALLFGTLAIVLGVAVYFLSRKTEAPREENSPERAENIPAGEENTASENVAPPRNRPVQNKLREREDAPPREPAPPSKTEIVLSGKWGGAVGDFGRKPADESNPEAPMAIVAGKDDELFVVDQVNSRIQKIKGGKVVSTIPASETVQDLAVGADGKTILLDRLADQKIQVFDADGKLVNEAPIAGKGLEEGGRATGVFSDSEGIWVENEHASSVKVADPNGNADTERPEIPGRPTRDGRAIITAAITDRASGIFIVTGFDRQSFEVLWSTSIQLPAPIIHLLALESDANSNSYVAADIGRESAEEPYPIVDERVIVVRLSNAGEITGMIEIPASATGDEMIRPITVGADGAVYAMTPGETGLSITRYTF
jgi:hypothetical protein